jgi:hypothetical protein
MKKQYAIVFLAALLASPASAGRRRSAAPVDNNALSIVFVDGSPANGTLAAAGSDAWLDAKEIAHHAGSHERGTRVQQRFGIRIVRTAGSAAGMAVVTAYLESSDGRTSMRLDGKLLTDAPVIIDAHAAIGAVVFHTLEIEINDAVAPGPTASAIGWEATAQ